MKSGFHLFNQFKCRLISTEDALCPHQPRILTSFKMVAKVKEIVDVDARYATIQTASIVGIYLRAAHTILTSDFKIRKIFL